MKKPVQRVGRYGYRFRINRPLIKTDNFPSLLDFPSSLPFNDEIPKIRIKQAINSPTRQAAVNRLFIGKKKGEIMNTETRKGGNNRQQSDNIISDDIDHHFK